MRTQRGGADRDGATRLRRGAAGGFSVAALGVVASAVNRGWGAAVVTGLLSAASVTGVLLVVRARQRRQGEAVQDPRD